jgi:hypothetical protein
MNLLKESVRRESDQYVARGNEGVSNMNNPYMRLVLFLKDVTLPSPGIF